jgi:hypothetical protein
MAKDLVLLVIDMEIMVCARNADDSRLSDCQINKETDARSYTNARSRTIEKTP